MSVYCDCDGPPWPPMLRVHAGGEPARFYLCRRCATVRVDLTTQEGLTTDTRYHGLESESLPAAVVEQARAILDAPRYRQLGLFGSDAERR